MVSSVPAVRIRTFSSLSLRAMLPGMSRRRASMGVLPDDHYIEPAARPRIGRPPKHDIKAWTVTDNWPERVPVTQSEFDVFEAWFGDLFDELLGPLR